MRIFYIIPTTGLYGGVKIVFEQANHLIDRGYEVYILTKDRVPNWMRVNAYFAEPGEWQNRIREEDIVIFTWDEDVDYVLKTKGRKYYLVQHFVHIREDIFKMGINFISISSYVQKHTKEKYGVDSYLVLNAIDHTVFYPSRSKVHNRVLAIARKGFKRFADIKKAMSIVKKEYPEIDFVAVNDYTPEQMAAEYSQAEIFISASEYEGFGLPVLEGMACGAAVVTTESMGIDDFAIDRETCLKVPVKDYRAIAKAVLELLKNEKLRKKLQSNGLKKAKEFRWSKSIDALEKALELDKNKIPVERKIPNLNVFIEDFNLTNLFTRCANEVKKQYPGETSLVLSHVKGIDKFHKKDFLLYLKSPSVLPELNLPEMINFMTKNPGVDIICPKVLSEGKVVPQFGRKKLYLRNWISKIPLLKRLKRTGFFDKLEKGLDYKKIHFLQKPSNLAFFAKGSMLKRLNFLTRQSLVERIDTAKADIMYFPKTSFKIIS